MSEAADCSVSSPEFWRQQLKKAPPLYRALIDCSEEEWGNIQAKHEKLLQANVGANDWIMDIGCGWGRLYDLLPAGWNGRYVGIDISPEFIKLANRLAGDDDRCRFVVADAWGLTPTFLRSVGKDAPWDLALVSGIRRMTVRHRGADDWNRLEAKLDELFMGKLILEYRDDND